MDDPALPFETYARCLRDLEAVNRLTLTHGPTLRWLARATRSLPPGETVSVLDVGCGGGDLLRAVWRWARKAGRVVRLEGLDLNPRAALVARERTPEAMGIRLRTGDVFADAPDPAPDFILSSQFTHHLDDAALLRFVGWLERHARRGWHIADLHRHPLPYLGFPVLARVAGWHRIVREDGTISIARGFRRAEWEAVLAAAGVAAELRWHLLFRHGIGRLR